MEGTIGEIRLFASNFAPYSWAFCNGMTLPIRNFTALFSIIGTTYGGDGINTFALPSLSGRTAIGAGQGDNLTNYQLGAFTGTNATTLLLMNVPIHTHQISGNILLPAYSEGGDTDSPSNNVLASYENMYSNQSYDSVTRAAPISVQVGVTGSNLPINIMKPSIGMNYIICLDGIYPSRS